VSAEWPVLWDVDTQVDFVLPGGKLHVEGAERILPAFARLVDAAREAGIVHVASADDHELSDAEISAEPDWNETYPPHCLHGTPGAAKVDETRQVAPVVLAHERLDPGELAARLHDAREILIPKKRFDVFSNPNTEPLVMFLDPREVLVFGVATDVCDDAAIRGLVRLGRRIAFVEDAAAGIDAARVEAAKRAWRDLGVRFTTVDEAVTELAG
jgi:nicotinamidase/pyrazinamidase